MNQFASRRRFEILALSLALVLCVLHWWADSAPVTDEGIGPFQLLLRGVHYLEGRAMDMQFQARGPLQPPEEVLVAVVDERSAQRFGLWPWRRSLIATALTHMHTDGAAAIGMDIIFTDPDPSGVGGAYHDLLVNLDRALTGIQVPPSVAAYREGLAALSSASPDQQLAEAFGQIPEVVLGVMAYSEDERKDFEHKIQEQAEVLEPFMLRTFPAEVEGSTYEALDKVKSWPSYSARTPLRMFARQAKHVGFFNVPQDPDGTLRRIPLFTKLESPKGLLPCLALQTAAVYLRAQVEPEYDPVTQRLVGARLRRTGAPTVHVPMELSEPKLLVNHLGPDKVFRTVSLSDVVDGTYPPGTFKGKAVLMGVNLTGLFDQRVTPFNHFESGVFSQASLLSNIITGSFLTRPLAMRAAEILFMLASALALAVLVPRLSFASKLVVVLAFAGGWVLLAQYLFSVHRVQVQVVLPVASVLLCSFGVIFLSYLSVDREKGVLRQAFQYYLNESVMEKMLDNPEMLKLGGEKKEMTVLFSDIRGFTTLSERMAPEALVKFINSYLTPMTQIVFDEGGTLDKYIGDALMAFWGAPLEQPDHATRACRASVRFLDKLQDLKAMWRDQNLPEFDIGVGINSGPMIVGNMGSDIRFDYTVMGDSVNLASRLEGTNKEYETRLLISEATYVLAKADITARRLGAVRVKGKRKPVRIYELRRMGRPETAEAEAIGIFDAALELYTEGKFLEAERGFEQVLRIWPDDPPCRRYLDEIAILKTRPLPPTWDGVYTATHK